MRVLRPTPRSQRPPDVVVQCEPPIPIALLLRAPILDKAIERTMTAIGCTRVVGSHGLGGQRDDHDQTSDRLSTGFLSDTMMPHKLIL